MKLFETSVFISIFQYSALGLLSFYPVALQAQAGVATSPGIAATTSNSWIDKDTGHRVIQLTGEINSRGLYFNENAYTPDGLEMIYTAPKGVYVLDLTTYSSRLLLAEPVTSLVVGHKSPVVYYTKTKDKGLYAIGVNTGKILKVADLPDRATISSVNADETLVAGIYTEVDPHPPPIDPKLTAQAARATMMDQRLAAHLPMDLFTVNLQTGETRTVLHSTDWLGHVQFSPKDATLLMYCHEGLWFRVDRIWTIRTDGTHNQLIHLRTMNNEIAGHEFWDADGKTIWYDLQLPRGQNFYLASYNTETEMRHWYALDRDAWSIHYSATPDDALFSGDGGDYSQVAKSKNGQWIELFHPHESDVQPEVDATKLVQSGFLKAEHLVNMSRQNYVLEPNVRFSPDHKLVIFTSNMFGPSYVYAVEVGKAPPVVAP